ncbi:MAG: DUF2442 domain-containing protein [Bacteroidota bacterium]
MKISVNYSDIDNQILKIKTVNHLKDFTLDLVFIDGSKRIIDFKPFLSKSFHPSIKKYLNLNYFLNFKIVNGNLNWNDYDLIFPIHDLYSGKID